jgi:hypothetical protein
MAFAVTPEMLASTTPFPLTQPPRDVKPFPEYISIAEEMHSKYKAGQLIRLEPSECMDEYAKEYQFQNSHVLLVAEAINRTLPSYIDMTPPRLHRDNGTRFDFGRNYHDSFGWICEQLNRDFLRFNYCSLHRHRIDPSDWRPLQSKVLYCLSSPAVQRCKLQFVPPLAWTVVVFNFAKVLLLGIVFWDAKGTSPLLTIGDAVMSFL